MAKLYFRFSTMNAGKSASLIQSNYNYNERGMRTLVLKPAIDTRESTQVVKSRIGIETECLLFAPEADLYLTIKRLIEENKNPCLCIFVDESQFMTPDQVTQLGMVVDKLDIPVICYGLRTDFQGNLFPGSARLFALANELEEIRTVCWCAKRATMVLRVDDQGNVVKDGEQIQVGGNDSYVSVCRKHFFAGLIGKPS